MLNDPWIEKNCHHNSKDGTVEMRIVVDAIAGIFRCPYAISQIKDGKQPGRHGNDKENAQHGLRLEEDKAEQYCADGSRRPQAVVVRIAAFFEHGTHITQHQTKYIEQRKLEMPPCTQAYEEGFKCKTKKIEGEHVE